MLIKKYNEMVFQKSTAVTLISMIHRCQNDGQVPFNYAVVKLLPGEESLAHQHHDAETFTIIDGSATVTSNGITQQVSTGDIIHFQPFCQHSIKNLSYSQPLIYQTIWWQPGKIDFNTTDMSLLTNKDKILIFSSLATPNGDLHLGHLAGPYLAADMLYRYYYQQGCDSYHYTGVEHYQSFVAYLANLTKTSLTEIGEKFANKISKTFLLAGINITPTNQPNNQPIDGEEIITLLETLQQKGFIEQVELDTPYCQYCNDFLYDSFLQGYCQNCHQAMRGCLCENCFSYHCEQKIIDPCCYKHHHPVTWIKKKHFVFKLSQFKNKLMTFYSKTSMPEFVKDFCYQQIDKLCNIPLNHYGRFGIPLRIDHQIIMIRSILDLTIRYINTIQIEKDSSCIKIIQCLGMDNCFNRLVLIPALVMAYDESIKLADINIINHFYLLNGDKFSTSRNNSLHISELLQHYPLDMIRYYLAWTRPEFYETNFSYDDFLITTRKQLLNRWIAYREKITLLEKQLSEFKFSPGTWNDRQKIFLNYLKMMASRIDDNYQSAIFSPSNICQMFNHVIDETIIFISKQLKIFKHEHLKGEQRTTLYLIITATKLFALLIAPVMFNFAEKIGQACGINIHCFPINRLFTFDCQSIDFSQLHYSFTTCHAVI